MRAITLTEPYATLMAIGAKRIETRSWYPAKLRRGEQVAIHAAKSVGRMDDFGMLCERPPFHAALVEAVALGRIPAPVDGYGLPWHPSVFPLGCVFAIASYEGAWPTESPDLRARLTEQERAFGNYAPGRWAWVFSEIEPLAVPAPARGALGLWQWSGGDAGAVAAATMARREKGVRG